MRKLLLILITLNTLIFADIDYTVQNSNIQINEAYSYNYNRLRLNMNYTDDDYFATLIADGVNYYGQSYINSHEFNILSGVKSDTPYKTQTSFRDYEDGLAYAKLYRLYGGYQDIDNRVTFGLQNITMGVGRFWNPTNLFNPKNIYAIEPDETFGVMALSYIRYLNDTTSINVLSSVKEDETLKYALRYKTFLEYGDVALDFMYSDTTKMLGYELEANLFDTGVEVRSEGAYVESSLNNTQDKVDFYQAILGAEYGFVNGLSLTVETLYSSQDFNSSQMLSNLNSDIISNMTSSKFYAGASLSYVFNIFLDGSILYIDSFEKQEDAFTSATLNYTLNDYNSFVFGVMSQEDEIYYIKYQLAF
jgi:hypothetical protein